MSDPSGISSETSSSATKSPNVFLTSRTVIMRLSPRGLIRVMASNVPSAISARSADAAYAPARSKFWKRFSTSRVSVSVSPEILPETTDTAPNSPMQRATDSTTP